MGLSRIELGFFRAALESGLIPPGGDILEIGESQPVPSDAGPALLDLLETCVPPERLATAAERMTLASQSTSEYQKEFGPGRALYHAIFDPASYTAVDLNPGPRRLCLDLNRPVSLQWQFDRVINNGTSEHVFDQANVYRAMHDHTRPGGLMIHWTPGLGWIDHGFFNVQPSFFFDLAAANGYDVKLVGLGTEEIFVPLDSGKDVGRVLEEHPEVANSMCFAILEKTSDAEFIPPLQSDYPYSPETMTLAQMARHRLLAPGPNLALGKPALQSTTSIWSWHDDPALDASGANNGRLTGNYGFHTEREDEPWWMVDLGSASTLNEAMIYNCLEGPDIAARSAHLQVSLSDDGETWRTVYQRTDEQPFGGADGRPLRVPLNREVARFVRISLPEGGWLHLDEVEVY